MNQNEQRNLDRVFGRIHVHTATSIRPLKPDVAPNAPVDKVIAKPKEAPVEQARIAPKGETSPLLQALRGTLPEMPPNVVKSKPAD